MEAVECRVLLSGDSVEHPFVGPLLNPPAEPPENETPEPASPHFDLKSNGTLVITGTDKKDDVCVRHDGRRTIIELVTNGEKHTFLVTRKVTKIEASLGAGDDCLKLNDLTLAMQVLGGEGDDTLIAGRGADSLDGGLGEDVIYAGFGDDTIDGGSGNDTVDGNRGADVVHGGDGNDSLCGGHGDAHCRVELAMIGWLDFREQTSSMGVTEMTRSEGESGMTR